MKNLMIALVLLIFCGATGCEEKTISTDVEIGVKDSKFGFNSDKETTYGLLTKCDENCSKSGWCTIAESSKCKTGSKVFITSAYKIKRPGGKPTVCSEFSSCAPKSPFEFVIIMSAITPDEVYAEITTDEGDVYATSYIVAFDEKNNQVYLKFSVKNEELGNSFLMLKAKTMVLNIDGEKIDVDISGELGNLDW